MAKKRGRYTQEEMKLHLKTKGKKNPTLKLTLFLPEDVVTKIYPQIKRFVEASKKRQGIARNSVES